jgi:hypothetical protein
VLATFSGGTAFADSGLQGATGHSSGAVSGNNIQAPVDAPVNVCGNTVSVAGALNPASGKCGSSESTQPSGTAGDSKGVGSGNNAQAPINAPVNVCGNGIGVLSEVDTASADCDGSSSVTPPGDAPDDPGPGNPGPDDPGPDNPGTDEPCDEGPENPGSDNPGSDKPGGGSGDSSDVTPSSDVRTQSEPVKDQLAHTGAGDMVGIGVPLSAGLLIGGFVLYRRASRLAQR